MGFAVFPGASLLDPSTVFFLAFCPDGLYKGAQPGGEVLELLLALQIARLLVGQPGAAGLCAGGGRPHVVFATDEGSIAAELYETAAPRTLRRLAELIRSPEFVAETGADPLTFDYTHPHIEIYTELLRPKESLLLENEIGAEALGLHEERIRDAGEAMDVFQREIMPAFNKVKKGGALHPRLLEWMTKWRQTMDAGFLVGASRKEVHEAIGYVYTPGLDSRAVNKGTLTLEAHSPSHATARFGIALSDLPIRRGRQMALGRVVEGLDLADDISIRPLDVPPGTRSLDYAPRDPVVIRSIQLECRK